MDACPKCGDTSGAWFVATEKNSYILDWDGGCECVDGGEQLARTMPECMACGHKFRWSTIKQQQENNDGSHRA